MWKNWESGTGGLRPGVEMVGGVFLSRQGPTWVVAPGRERVSAA